MGNGLSDNCSDACDEVERLECCCLFFNNTVGGLGGRRARGWEGRGWRGSRSTFGYGHDPGYGNTYDGSYSVDNDGYNDGFTSQRDNEGGIGRHHHLGQHPPQYSSQSGGRDDGGYAIREPSIGDAPFLDDQYRRAHGLPLNHSDHSFAAPVEAVAIDASAPPMATEAVVIPEAEKVV